MGTMDIVICSFWISDHLNDLMSDCKINRTFDHELGRAVPSFATRVVD